MSQLFSRLIKFFFFVLLISFMKGYASENVLKVVVLGSSTSAGTGATNGMGWVSRYITYLKGINNKNEVINLAKGGYSTYHIMPNGNSVSNRPSPDIDRNITVALLYKPDVIIVNMPSNDAANGYLPSEVMSNYAALKAIADAEGIEIYFTTTQPRDFDEVKKERQQLINSELIATYPERYLDFWSGIADSEGAIKPEYDSDGIHVNDAGHEVLFNIVVAKTSILSHAKPYIAPEYSALGRILIDFGGTVNLSTDKWNNVTGARQVGSAHSVTLKNENNEITPFKIFLHDAFNGVNNEGVAAGTNILDYPNSASNDSFFGNGSGEFSGFSEPTGGVTLDNLDSDILYSLKFFAGRRGVNDNRETKYTVKGKTTQIVNLNTSRNVATVVVENMEPNANNQIIIDVTYGDLNTNGDKFYYLGVLDIEYKPKTTPVELIGFGLSKNNKSVDLTWTTLSEFQNSHFEIYKSDVDNKFKLIGSVLASSTIGVNTYNYKDKEPLLGANYYFLRQIDLNGTFKDFEVKSINYDIDTKDLNVFVPIGTNKLMMIGGNDKGNETVEISVLRADGRLVKKTKVLLDEINREIEILRFDDKGIYIVLIAKADKISSYKIIY